MGTDHQAPVPVADVVVAAQDDLLVRLFDPAGEHDELDEELRRLEDPEAAAPPRADRIVLAGRDPRRLITEEDIVVVGAADRDETSAILASVSCTPGSGRP